MSPRAAARLETLGFTRVYDYVASEADWLAMGLPTEGFGADQPRAGQVADRGTPTCQLHERLSTIRDRVQVAGADSCLVIDADRVVLGHVGRKALDSAGDATVEAVMDAGPTTVRPNEPLADLITRLRAHDTHSIIVTTSDGRLVGLLNRADAERFQETET